MKKILLGIFLTVGFLIGSVYLLLPEPKSYVVLNEYMTRDVINKTMFKIDRLHRELPIEEEIIVYLNSPGGAAVPTIVLLERMNILKRKGRVFVGIIYGGCFSSCGSFFANMNIRFMTENSIYMQHATRNRNDKITNTTVEIDRIRLRPDADMLKKDVDFMINYFFNGDFSSNAQYMLDNDHIMEIVPFPKLREI